MQPHSLKKFWNTKVLPKFNGVYSRNNLPKINHWAYVIHLSEFISIRTDWIALYVNGNKISRGYSKTNLKSRRKQKYNNEYL